DEQAVIRLARHYFEENRAVSQRVRLFQPVLPSLHRMNRIGGRRCSDLAEHEALQSRCGQSCRCTLKKRTTLHRDLLHRTPEPMSHPASATASSANSTRRLLRRLHQKLLQLPIRRRISCHHHTLAIAKQHVESPEGHAAP